MSRFLRWSPSSGAQNIVPGSCQKSGGMDGFELLVPCPQSTSIQSIYLWNGLTLYMVALGGAFWVVPGISKIHLWLFQALLTPDRVHWVGARWFMKSDQFTTSCHRVVTALSKSTICYKALNEHSAVLKTRLWNSAGGLVFVWSVGGGRWGITRKGSNERSTHS